MPTGIRVLHRIPPCVQEPVVVDHHPRIGHHRVRAQERAQLRIVIAGVHVQQPGAVLLLPGEGPGTSFPRLSVAREVPVSTDTTTDSDRNGLASRAESVPVPLRGRIYELGGDQTSEVYTAIFPAKCTGWSGF